MPTDDVTTQTETQETTTAPAAETPAPSAAAPAATPAESAEGAPPADNGNKPAAAAKPAAAKSTIASGAKPEEETPPAAKPDPFAITDEMRRALAEHYAAGDKKALEKEMKRLERLGGDFKSLWGLYRDLDNRLNGGGLVKPPGKDAKPEDIEAFRKAVGVPEKPEGFLEGLDLANGAVIGDADKPLVNTFLQAVHAATTPQQFVNKALDWYYERQDAAAAELDQADDTFKKTSIASLKDELGASYDRKIAAIPVVFRTAPGGADWNNPNSLLSQLMAGRMADGRIIGDHPDVLKLLISLGEEIDPEATTMESGPGAVRTVQAELDDIRKLRSTDTKKYWSQEVQDRELQLIAALERQKERAQAR